MPLVHQRVPVEDESLRGLLGRLARLNHYPSVRWITDLLPSPRLDRPNLLRDPQQYRSLSQLTGLPIDTLAGTTLHSVVDRYLTATERAASAPVPELGIRVWDNGPAVALRSSVYGGPMAADKACPLCWQDRATLLLPWSLRHVTTCPVHDVLLVDHCPRCGKGLRVDPATGRCTRCQEQEIGTLPTVSIRDDPASQEVTALVWAAIAGGLDEVRQGVVDAHPGTPLGEMTPAALLRFLWHGAQILHAHDPNVPLLSQAQGWWGAMPTRLDHADVRATHGVLTAMWTLVCAWTTAWPALLTHYAEKEAVTADAMSGTRVHFPRALLTTFRDPEFAWLRHAWCAYMDEHMDVTPAAFRWYRYYQTIRGQQRGEASPLMGREEAARRVGISRRHLGEYVAQGRLPAHRMPAPRPWLIVDAEALDRCHEERGALLTLAQAARHIGMSQERLAALVRAELVPTADGPGSEVAPPWSFDRVEVERSIAALVGHLPIRPWPTDPDVHVLPLAKMLVMAEARGQGLAAILCALRDGEVAGWRGAETHRLRDLWCERDAWVCYLTTCTAPGGDATAEERYLSSIQVRHRLGCSWRTLRLWRLAGLLVPSRMDTPSDRKHWYARVDVDAFEARYLTLDRASLLVGCPTSDLYRRIKLGQYPGALVYRAHKDAYVFDRAILTHQVENWIEGKDAARILGISISGFNALVQQGTILPSVTTSGGRRRYDHNDIIQFGQAIHYKRHDRY